MTPHYYQDIQGWFDFQDVYREAVARAHDGAILVEVGCWRGQSLSYLLVEARNSGKRLDVVGVDHFQGGVGDDYHASEIAGGADIEAECCANCDRAEYPYRILKIDSAEVADFFVKDSLDFVFLDGSHDYASVKADIKVWLPKVRRGGTLAGHDYEGAWPGVKHAVRDFFMPNELSFSGCSWLYRKVPCGGGAWRWLPPAEAGWLLYLPYVNRPDLLALALDSVREHEPRVVVIDQSEGGDAEALHSGPLVRWPGRPRFTDVMTWMQRDAAFRGLSRYLFLHADARAAPGGVDMLLDEADRLDYGKSRWGAVFTHYDALALFNMRAVEDVGCWDGSFSWYVADADYYNRLRWAGWPTHDLPGACAAHEGSATLGAMSDDERRRAEEEQDWAIKHYRHKWGCHWEEGEGRAWAVPYDGRPG